MSLRQKLNLKKLKQQLLDRRSELLETSDSTVGDRAPVELDQAMQGRLSRMDALQQREMALATQRRREIDLVRIDAALQRMESDDYGYCLNCDEEIAAGRLNSDAAEPLCVECASTAKH